MVEGRQEEINIVLGWIIATRKFAVALPVDKYLVNSKHVKEILKARKVDDDNSKT